LKPVNVSVLDPPLELVCDGVRAADEHGAHGADSDELRDLVRRPAAVGSALEKISRAR
jgi:hypothetical protein